MAAIGGYIDPNYPDPNAPGDATIIIYGYIPSTALCALGVALSAIFSLAHLTRTIRSRAWFTVPLVVACFMELLGYIFRTLSNQIDPYRLAFFVGQYFLITTAPILITASLYFALTKILVVLKANHIPSPLNNSLGPRFLLWVFITADIVTTIVQVTGAALIGTRASHHESPVTANWIVLAGISIQTFFFLIYLSIFAIVFRTVIRSLKVLESSFIITVTVLGLASLSILLRLVFRIAETAQGVFGYLSVHEAFLGGLDFVPVMVAMALLVIWHPGTALRQHKRVAEDKPEAVREANSSKVGRRNP